MILENKGQNRAGKFKWFEETYMRTPDSLIATLLVELKGIGLVASSGVEIRRGRRGSAPQ